MKITKVNCTSCGAPISIPEDLDFINCSSCGSFLSIERGEGYVALKAVEKVVRAVEQTQQEIRTSTEVTRSELQRLQLSQEVTALQSQLANIQAEIRTLLRLKSDSKTKRQIEDLHTTEYQLMDRLRCLDGQIASALPQSITTRIQMYEKEISWIDTEVQSLTMSNHPQRWQVIQQLRNRKNELSQTIADLKISDLKSKLPSFQTKELPIGELAAAAAFLGLLAADELALRNQRRQPEVNAVYQEIQARKQKVQQSWASMEQARVQAALHSIRHQPDPSNLNSLKDHLSLLDQDLTTLRTLGNNDVIQAYEKAILQQKKTFEKQINQIEKKMLRNQPRQQRRKEKTVSTAEKAGLAALLGAASAGVLGSIKKIQKKGTLPDNYVPNTQKQSDKSGTMDSELIDSQSIPTKKVYPTKMLSPGKSVVGGILLGLLYTLAAFVIGIIFLAVTSNSSQASYFSLGIFILVLTCGITLGARTFFRRTTPGVVIRGFRNKPILTIKGNFPAPGALHRKVVIVLAGLFSGIIFFLFFLGLNLLFSPEDGQSVLSTTLIVISTCLTPLLIIFVLFRASVLTFESDNE